MLIPDAPAVGQMAESSPTVPEATYNFRVHKSEYVHTPKSKDAKGPYIKTQLVITGPGEEHVGRFVFQNYSLTGDGSFRLRELLKVTNHPDDFRLEEDSQLLGLEFGASVIIKPEQNGYPPKNEIRRHMSIV